MSNIGQRIGVLGGSFDPIHLAHLVMAECVLEALGLDVALFVPAAEQPLKVGKPVTPAEHRVAMVKLAIAGNAHFALSRVDVDRPGPSYSVDTLRLLREERRGQGETEMWFIVGADALATFPKWRDPAGIFALARLAVVRRPGITTDMDALDETLPQLRDRIDWVDAPLLEISATDIRQRVSEGLSIRYRVPDAVREYIEREDLYR